MNTGTLGFPGSELLALFYGLIADYYGDPANISPAWRLCDGTNGTPDLRDRFVVGAGSTYALGATGGAVTKSYTPTGSVSTPTFTGSALAGHTHGVGTYVTENESSHTHGAGSYVTGTPSETIDVDRDTPSFDVATEAHTHTVTGTSGTGSAHNHTVSGSSESVSAGTPAGSISTPTFTGDAANINVLAPYYGLYKIMFVGMGTV